MRRKWKMSVLCAVFVFLSVVTGIFIAMQFNTNCIISDVENALSCKDYYVPDSLYRSDSFQEIVSEHTDTNFISYSESDDQMDLYAYLNVPYKYGYYDTRAYDVKVWVDRNYTVHNFRDGSLWLEYSISVDSEAEALKEIHSSYSCHMKCKIKKKAG